MPEKTTKPREKSKEKSKQAFMEAVGEILKTKGHEALKVNDIAAMAGLSKKLIYNYFGGTEQLLDEYLHSQDFWTKLNHEELIGETTNGGREITKQVLADQFDFVANHMAFQKILLWQLSEERPSLRKMIEDQEATGELLFNGISDPYFGEKATDFRAIMAILISGIYYLNLFTKVNGSMFCGIDLNTPEGESKIREALNFLVDKTYEGLK
ncbi:AcrR family transcriptional regulator [Chitinophaga dinghuensis]|uniref:AcrR family transcriptional regulator n=1 Tax=Chitinophaga dinghuensis TaxID=1539050 RepID=A0A327WFD1_9BACT|nr:TetR/AcrR family transcriptional regulator [Chitinophaga dinghuensis]RAJ88281.1 AcrR family transcriptional regulator [Chitinophaga dinghuensis]